MRLMSKLKLEFKSETHSKLPRDSFSTLQNQGFPLRSSHHIDRSSASSIASGASLPFDAAALRNHQQHTAPQPQDPLSTQLWGQVQLQVLSSGAYVFQDFQHPGSRQAQDAQEDLQGSACFAKKLLLSSVVLILVPPKEPASRRSRTLQVLPLNKRILQLLAPLHIQILSCRAA